MGMMTETGWPLRITISGSANVAFMARRLSQLTPSRKVAAPSANSRDTFSILILNASFSATPCSAASFRTFFIISLPWILGMSCERLHFETYKQTRHHFQVSVVRRKESYEWLTGLGFGGDDWSPAGRVSALARCPGSNSTEFAAMGCDRPFAGRRRR